MTSLGPVTYRRARYRSGASGASPVPVDESLGLVDDYLTRPAAELGLLMMGHCTAREAAAFFAKTGAMTPSVSTLQRLTLACTNFGTKEALFDNPKPVDLLLRLVSFSTGPNDIVLDLFAGTATTAEAVLRLNESDGGNRQSIMVQIPEAIIKNKPAYKAGYKTIAALGQARVQKVIASFNSEPIPGLRSFRLAESNIRRWNGVQTKDADSFIEQLEAFSDTLVDGWEPDNVIWEIALREGFALTSRIEQQDVVGQAIFCVTEFGRDQSFHICLDETITVDAVAALGLTREDVFVCRDKALDDTLAANLALQCRLKVL